ncbi:hypothetical protein C8R47DRAFT_43489 [Mycena vitilis]|nr:hypothetical protein C8R47DRAFT_43489 [Mycena vitilis]
MSHLQCPAALCLPRALVAVLGAATPTPCARRHQLAQRRALADLPLAVCPPAPYRFPRVLLAAHGAVAPALLHPPLPPLSSSLGTPRCLKGPWLDAAHSLCRHLPLSTRAPRCARRSRSRPCSRRLHCPPAASARRASANTSCAPPFPPLARAVPLDLQLLSHHSLIDPHFTVHHAPLCPPVLGSSVCSPLRAPTLLPLLPARRSRSGARTACRDSSGPLGTCSMLFSTVSQSRTSPRAPAVPATASSNSQYLTRF